MRRKSILYLLILSILLVYILPLYSSFAQDKGQERLKIDFSQFIEDGIEDKAGENLTIKDGEKKALLMEKFFFYKEMFRDKPIYIIAGEEKSTHRMGQDLTLDLELERGEYLLVLEKKDYDLLEEDYVFEFIVKDEAENTIYPRLALSPEQKEALEEKLSLVKFLFSTLAIGDDLRLVLENDFDKKDFSLEELSNKKFLLPDGSYKISVEEKAIDYLEEDHVFDFTIEKTLEDKEKSFLIELDNIKDKPACFDQEKEDKKPAGNQKDLSYLTIDFSLALDKGKKTLLTRDKLSEKEDLGFDDKLIGTKFMVETKEGEEAYILGKDLKIVMEKPGGKIKIKVFKKDLDLLSKDFIYEIDLDERDDKDLYLYIGMDDFLKTEKDLEKPAPNPSLRNKNLADEHMEINIYYPGEKDQAFKRFSQGEPIKIEVLAKIKNFNDRDMRNVKRLQIGYRTINNVFQKLSVEYKNLGDKDYKKFNNLDEIYYGDFVNLSEEEREAILKEKKFNHFSNNSRSYIQFSTDLFKDNRVSNNFEIKLTYYLHKHFYYSDDLTNNKGTISPYGYIYEARQWQEGEYNIHSYTVFVNLKVVH